MQHKKSEKERRVFNLNEDKLNYKFSYNDDETKELHEKLNGALSISIDDLRRVSLWKLDRVLSVNDETLKKLSELSQKENLTIDDDIVKEVIEMLVNSSGIGFPMASAILKFINPEVFPIIDVRAYRAITGKKPYYSTYTYERYIEYTMRLKEISKAKGLPLRDIDEQLYCFDKENNGTI